MSDFEDEMGEVLVELLTEFGWAGELVRTHGGALDLTTLEITQGNTRFPIQAVFFDPTTSSLSGFEQSLTNDYILSKKWILVNSPDTKVESGDFIESVAHGKFRVDMATGVGPSNPIYYKVAANKVS